MRPATMLMIDEESARAVAQHAGHTLGDGDDMRSVAILTEEVGEVAQAVLDYRRNPSIEGAKRIHSELVQVASVSIRWLEKWGETWHRQSQSK